MPKLPSEAHKNRVRQELIAAGMTKYGLLKFEVRRLPGVIHENEHIGGVIYGRYKNGSAVMVATDRRLIFMDHKPFFRLNDELTYDVLSGISYNVQGRYAGIVVHTRLGDYSIRFVNKKSATKFVEFVEQIRIEKPDGRTARPESLAIDSPKAVTLNDEVKRFLLSHDLATLSTADSNGQVAGAVVYYVLVPEGVLYVVTKSDTKKAHNINQHRQVALTVFDASTAQTLQMEAVAEVEQDDARMREILSHIVKPRLFGKDISWPPITKLIAGTYVAIKISPTSVRFFDYKNS